ncbi:hypothetical protein [Chromatium okenii]|uniref:hypothetical protein n=1 Tax=Chromatium okenii TaxID=61644 RepID=UPI003D6ABF1F
MHLVDYRRKSPRSYGDIANLQGRVIGQNLIAEGSAKFPGITHTGICKIFDYTVGFTGLSATRALALDWTSKP